MIGCQRPQSLWGTGGGAVCTQRPCPGPVPNLALLGCGVGAATLWRDMQAVALGHHLPRLDKGSLTHRDRVLAPILQRRAPSCGPYGDTSWNVDTTGRASSLAPASPGDCNRVGTLNFVRLTAHAMA